MRVYITEGVFSWKATRDGGTIGHQEGWDTPYRYFDLAQRISDEHSDTFQLVDLVANLKRSIDHRLKKISRDYAFKRLNRFDFPKDTLGKLEQFGVVRPTMLKVISGLRNQIEHGFDTPPSLARCQELLDFTWYFLKSTDEICRLIPDRFYLKQNHVLGYDSEIWLEFQVSPIDGWKNIFISGDILPKHFTNDHRSGIGVDCNLLDGYRTEKNHSIEHRVDIRGSHVASTPTISKIIQSYFAADPYV
jgi:hypothetical protein